MISTWCGTPNLSMWSSPAGDRLSTTRKAIWRPAIESIDHGKYPGIPAPAAPSKTANDGRKPDGKNNKDGGTGPIAVKKAVPTVAWPVGPILNNKDGGTGPIAVKKAVPTVAWPVGPILNNRDKGTVPVYVMTALAAVAWPVGPILNKCGPTPATGCTFAHSGAHIGKSGLCSLGSVKGGVAVYPVALQGEVNTWPGNGTVIRKIENFKARRPSADEISSRRELLASVRPFSRRREQP